MIFGASCLLIILAGHKMFAHAIIKWSNIGLNFKVDIPEKGKQLKKESAGWKSWETLPCHRLLSKIRLGGCLRSYCLCGCVLCSIRVPLFSNSCPQESHLFSLDLLILFIWLASDTWLSVIFGHRTHVLILLMHIIIVFVHYLLRCTRLTPFFSV